MPPTVTLQVTRGPLRGEEFVFAERGTSILGRAPDCSPRLPDDHEHRTISRHHCLLDVNPPDIRVRDFGSRNGTYVNGRKIGQREAHQTAEDVARLSFPEHDLTDGDEIRLGSTVLRVHVTVPPTCSVCGTELPRDTPGNGPPRCMSCRTKRAADPSTPATPASQRCAVCERPTGDGGTARAGAVVCAACRDAPQKLARRLLRDAAAGNRELAGIQGYTLLHELGRGGMGAVYLARHEATGTQVALKLMLPKIATSAQARQRFLRETALTQELRHPHIAAVHDVGSAHGSFYFTIEFCAGGSLDNLVRRHGGTLPVDEALDLTVQALHGLEYAHDQGVVHRDLSPQNILLASDETKLTAKICDFGLAKAFDQAGLSGLTRTGTAAGKPTFMPRQQVINFKNARPAVDVWAMAACLYWLLTGNTPRDFPPGKDPWRIVLQDEPVPIRQRVATVPRGLAEVIDEVLRDQPDIGIQTAAELRQALQRAR